MNCDLCSIYKDNNKKLCLENDACCLHDTLIVTALIEKVEKLEQENTHTLSVLENCLEFVDSGVPGYEDWKKGFDAI